MAIEVRIPKEITEYKEKIMFGMNIRQLVSSIIAILVGVGSYFLLNPIWGQEITSYVVILEVIPIFAVGFIRLQNMAFEKYIKLMLHHAIGQGKRTYKTELLLDDYIKEVTNGVIEGKKKGGRRSARVNAGAERRARAEAINTPPTAKSRKAAGKAAKKKIKCAKQDYRKTKRQFKKEAKKRKKAGIGAEQH